jgi:hypothetical protein
MVMDPVGGPFTLARRPRQPVDPRDTRPLGVLLLPQALERCALRVQAEDLLRAPGVLAIEPARISYESYLRLPLGFGDGMAAIQAKRLRLPGAPHFILIFGALQYPLARALISEHPACELWYAPEASEEEKSRRRRERIEELHSAADRRAALVFDVDRLRESDRFPPAVWERVESLGIESGRLGSERPSITGL